MRSPPYGGGAVVGPVAVHPCRRMPARTRPGSVSEYAPVTPMTAAWIYRPRQYGQAGIAVADPTCTDRFRKPRCGARTTSPHDGAHTSTRTPIRAWSAGYRMLRKIYGFAPHLSAAPDRSTAEASESAPSRLRTRPAYVSTSRDSWRSSAGTTRQVTNIAAVCLRSLPNVTFSRMIPDPRVVADDAAALPDSRDAGVPNGAVAVGRTHPFDEATPSHPRVHRPLRSVSGDSRREPPGRHCRSAQRLADENSRRGTDTGDHERMRPGPGRLQTPP